MRTRVSRVGVMVRAVVLTAALSAFASGCGGRFSGEAELPDGWRTFEAQNFSFGHPGSWSKVTRRPERDGRLVQVSGPPVEGGYTPFVGAIVSNDVESDFETAYQFSEALGRARRGQRVLGREDVEVPGAKQARLTTSEFTVTGASGEQVRIRDKALFLISEDGLGIAFTASRPVARPETLDLDAAIDSFRLEQ